jgi:lipid-A-disaccharide synthase
MTDQKNKYRIFLSAAEASGDAHCAGLIRELKKSDYDIEITGVGGPKMALAGCQLLQNTVDKAAMIYKAFSQISHFYRLIRRISLYFKVNKVDLVIVCDSPSFNFHIAKAAKKNGIKTIFYVAPQLWAWGGWRIKKLRKNCDKLCCILPFEQEWFNQRGVDTIFVGNPLLDLMQINPAEYKKYADFEPEKARFAIMPGSRAAEIESLWIPIQQIAIRLKDKFPKVSFITVAVDPERQEKLKAKQIPEFKCQYQIDSVYNTAKKADFSIVASGSATLEVASAGCPMVIMYQSSSLLWHLVGKWLVKTKYLSLVNILSQKKLVPEFMPYFKSINPIITSIEQYLQNNTRLVETSRSLMKLTKPLAGKNAGGRVAQISIEMLS